LLNDGVDTSVRIFIDLVETDVVLAVARVTKLRHCERSCSGYNNGPMYFR
jgi:hypothetical protein